MNIYAIRFQNILSIRYLAINMKRVGAISLMFIFLVSSIGLTVKKHYCGGHLASISMFVDGGCGCDDMEDESSCCRTESETYRIIDSYDTHVNDLIVSDCGTEIPSAELPVLTFHIEDHGQYADYLNYRPPLISTDILTKHQVFRL